MTDTPDLRTLAAELAQVMRDANTVDAWDVTRGLGPNFVPFGHFAEVAIAWMHAAVLPEHRRQVLAEAERQVRHRADGVPWSDPTLRRGIQYAAATVAMLTRDSASAATETAPRHRQDDEAAPAVGREAAQARDEVATNAGHPQLLNMTVVQSWRTPWVPLTDATPADGQDGDGHG